jgi:hypothetical protein
MGGSGRDGALVSLINIDSWNGLGLIQRKFWIKNMSHCNLYKSYLLP